MLEVVLERAAEKDLRRLSDEIHDRVIEGISALATDPRPPGSKKLAGSKQLAPPRGRLSRALRDRGHRSGGARLSRATSA